MKMKVWWIPQVPMKAFEVAIPEGDNQIEMAILLLQTLADYDIFQLENNIKPDFSNVGGLSVLEDGEWVDWEDSEGNGIYHYVEGG